MSVKIPEWGGTSHQFASDSKGNKWLTTDLIEQAKGLSVMDIPLEHLCVDASIEGIPIRTFVMHMKATLRSDLNCPIILDENGAIFDGRHRAAKAIFEEAKSIKAVRFDSDPAPTIQGKSDDQA